MEILHCIFYASLEMEKGNIDIPKLKYYGKDILFL